MTVTPIFQTCRSLILASSSPRRHDLLHNLGLDFAVLPARVDETPHAGEPAGHFAGRMAEAKAASIATEHPQAWVLGADTVVSLDGEILGKPLDTADALNILRKLSGATHQVITAVTLYNGQENIRETVIDRTRVTFVHAGDDMLRAYVNTGEPLDKAGAYGIQGAGSFLVEKISGSYTNVVGLPLNICLSLLLDRNVIRIIQLPGIDEQHLQVSQSS